MRTLLLTLFEPGSYHVTQRRHKHGLRTAFEQHGPTLEWDYLDNDAATRFQGLINRIEQFQPDLLMLQIGHDVFSADQLTDVRQRYPNLVTANWNGDYWPDVLTAPAMLDILRYVDVQLVVNASVLPIYEQHGVNAAFWPFGYETANAPLPDMPAHDVVYLGNAYSDHRHELERVLRALPYNVGIYGSGWQQSDGNTTYDFPAGESLYSNAKLTISDNQFPDARGYLSNRPFQAMVAGCFVLQQSVADLKALTGLMGGVHYIQFTALDELPALVAYWLASERDNERETIAAKGQRFVSQYHNFEKRVDELVAMLPRLQGVRA